MICVASAGSLGALLLSARLVVMAAVMMVKMMIMTAKMTIVITKRMMIMIAKMAMTVSCLQTRIILGAGQTVLIDNSFGYQR